MLIPLSFKVINKLAIEPGFICFPTNLKLIEGGPYSRGGGAYLMFGLTGARFFGEGRLFERGRLFEEIRYSPIYLGGGGGIFGHVMRLDQSRANNNSKMEKP